MEISLLRLSSNLTLSSKGYQTIYQNKAIKQFNAIKQAKTTQAIKLTERYKPNGFFFFGYQAINFLFLTAIEHDEPFFYFLRPSS